MLDFCTTTLSLVIKVKNKEMPERQCSF